MTHKVQPAKITIDDGAIFVCYDKNLYASLIEPYSSLVTFPLKQLFTPFNLKNNNDGAYQCFPDKSVLSVTSNKGGLIISFEDKCYVGGNNHKSQLGMNGNSSITFVDNNLPNLKIVDLSQGWGHTLALTDDGDVYGAGFNLQYQFGFGHNQLLIHQFTKLNTANGTKVVKIATGMLSSYMLTADKKIYGCGISGTPFGINGTNISLITDIEPIVDVSAHLDCALLLTESGKVLHSQADKHGGNAPKLKDITPNNTQIIAIGTSGNTSWLLDKTGLVYKYGRDSKLADKDLKVHKNELTLESAFDRPIVAMSIGKVSFFLTNDQKVICIGSHNSLNEGIIEHIKKALIFNHKLYLQEAFPTQYRKHFNKPLHTSSAYDDVDVFFQSDKVSGLSQNRKKPSEESKLYLTKRSRTEFENETGSIDEEQLHKKLRS